MKLRRQKYLIISFLLSLNLILSSTYIIYNNEWYVYLFILALASFLSSCSCLLIVGEKMLIDSHNAIEKTNRLTPRNYMYIMPCYNESAAELTATLNSLMSQRDVRYDKRAIFIICDGTSVNGNNICNNSLKHILGISELNMNYYTYPTWDNLTNAVQVYKTFYHYLDERLPVILLIKAVNYGKRDSLVLARSLCHKYNKALKIGSTSTTDTGSSIKDVPDLTLEMINNLNFIFEGERIDYVIGIDADTLFDYNCSYELIKGLEARPDIYGCVGYVDIGPKTNFYSPFILYQYAEYMFAQCLRRYAQSTITKKVNCLSGCVQILRVAEETCGERLMTLFNYLPQTENESILNHIRSYASEDRNHVCYLLSQYPQLKTTQNLKAIAYTQVPMSVAVFMSQRRRWSLGANTNDMLLVYLPGILWVERISSFVNVLTFSLSPFIFIATILFLKAIFLNPTPMMLYLSSILLVPLSYAFLFVPVFIRPLTFRDTLYYYLSLVFFLISSSIVNLCVYGYALACMDVIKWGKTRQLTGPSGAEPSEAGPSGVEPSGAEPSGVEPIPSIAGPSEAGASIAGTSEADPIIAGASIADPHEYEECKPSLTDYAYDDLYTFV